MNLRGFPDVSLRFPEGVLGVRQEAFVHRRGGKRLLARGGVSRGRGRGRGESRGSGGSSGNRRTTTGAPHRHAFRGGLEVHNTAHHAAKTSGYILVCAGGEDHRLLACPDSQVAEMGQLVAQHNAPDVFAGGLDLLVPGRLSYQQHNVLAGILTGNDPRIDAVHG